MARVLVAALLLLAGCSHDLEALRAGTAGPGEDAGSVPDCRTPEEVASAMDRGAAGPTSFSGDLYFWRFQLISPFCVRQAGIRLSSHRMNLAT